MDMPDDMLLEIFSWLPAKSICKFKCLNKFFNSTTSNDAFFIQKQVGNSLLKGYDPCFFLQPNWVQRYKAKTEFHQLRAEKTQNSSFGVSDRFLQFLDQYPACRIVASSNGLILGRSYNNFFICNPVTQLWLPVATPDCLKKHQECLLNIALECTGDQDSNQFMLFEFDAQDDFASYCYDVKLYSIKEGKWKEIETRKSFFTGPRRLEFNNHVYFKKALHFISDCYPDIIRKCLYFRPYIMAYNIENGSSKMFRVPKEARVGSHDRTCQMAIYKWGKPSSSSSSSTSSNDNESICLVRFRKKVFTVWVLTDYEANMWRKILKVRVKAMGIEEEDDIITVTGFTVMNGERLIFSTKKKVYGYGLSKENYMKLEEICEHGFGRDGTIFTAYSDTLRSCGDNSTATLLPLLPQQH